MSTRTNAAQRKAGRAAGRTKQGARRDSPLRVAARVLADRIEKAAPPVASGPDALAKVACEALEDWGGPDDGVASRLLTEALDASGPRASSDAFSDLGVTLAVTRRLVVEALVWLDASTAAHDHAFVGAFRLLQGESLHATFRFREQSCPGPGLRLGRLARKRVERLQPGDIRAIPRGGAFVHSVVHLARPSITLVVRERFPSAPEQWNYLAPGLAYDPFQLRERAGFASTWARAGAEIMGTDVLAGMTESFDDDRLVAFAMARQVYGMPAAVGFVDSIARKLAPKHPGIVHGALAADAAQRALIGARRAVRSQDGRLLLGLLSVSRGREELVEASRSALRVDEPAATRWIAETFTALGTSWPSLDAPRLDRRSLDAVHLAMFEARDSRDLRARLRRAFDREDLERHERALGCYAERLRTHAALHMVFS